MRVSLPLRIAYQVGWSGLVANVSAELHEQA